MQAHVFGRRQQRAVVRAGHLVEEAQTLVIGAQHLGLDRNGNTGLDLAQVPDVDFHRVVAAASLVVLGRAADEAQHGIGRISEDLEIAAFGHVAVVVHPLRIDRGGVQLQGLGEINRLVLASVVGQLEELGVIGLQHLAGAPPLGLQRLHDRHEVVVADTTCLAIFSTNSSVISGVSISLVQGHFSAGPNWAIKCRMPCSPPAMSKTWKVPICAQRRPQP